MKRWMRHKKSKDNKTWKENGGLGSLRPKGEKKKRDKREKARERKERQ